MTTEELDVLLQEFSEIIADTHIEKDKQEKGVQFFKARIILKDSSCLALYEAIKAGSRKYGYQWMRQDNSLIICWDNADHHPEIETHPASQARRNSAKRTAFRRNEYSQSACFYCQNYRGFRVDWFLSESVVEMPFF